MTGILLELGMFAGNILFIIGLLLLRQKQRIQRAFGATRRVLMRRAFDSCRPAR